MKHDGVHPSARLKYSSAKMDHASGNAAKDKMSPVVLNSSLAGGRLHRLLQVAFRVRGRKLPLSAACIVGLKLLGESPKKIKNPYCLLLIDSFRYYIAKHLHFPQVCYGILDSSIE